MHRYGQAPISGVPALPLAATVVVALNALNMLLVAFGNITDFGRNHAFVQHLLAMDTTNVGIGPGTMLDSDVMWRAITNTTIQDAADILIIA